jgi:hypothetical protein
MSKESRQERIEEARELLDVAKEQMDAAITDAWEPAEPADCVTKSFYAYENALMAAVLAVGGSRTNRHWEKAKLAHKLFRDKTLKTDVSDRLSELNELRKDVSYGHPGPTLRRIDLAELTADLESFINEVEVIVSDAEEQL